MPSRAVASTRKRRALPVWQWPFAIVAVAIGGLAYSYLTLPDVRPLATTNPTTTAFIEIRDDEARTEGRVPKHTQRWVAYNRISPELKRAVLIAEDDAFWQHEGVDFEELQKSIELDWARGQMVRGASTITQQLAKNLYLSPSRNPVRKLREWIIARRLEAELKKARILELYLNVIEWGDGIYGVEAASRAYFNLPAAALDANRSALLAAAIINPRVMNPLKPTPRLFRRQQIILKRMGSVAPPDATAVSHTKPPSHITESPSDNPVPPESVGDEPNLEPSSIAPPLPSAPSEPDVPKAESP